MLLCDIVYLIGIRKMEKKQLQKGSYVQSANTSIGAIIPTVATIVTFVIHTSLGLKLSISDVSTMIKQHIQ